MKKHKDSPIRIQLSEERKEDILRKLTEMYQRDYDEELSRFRGEQILQFFLTQLGPSVYNQAIQDACAFMMEKVQDLDATYYEKEENGQPGVVADLSRLQEPYREKGKSRSK